jgi:hypothetical protein
VNNGEREERGGRRRKLSPFLLFPPLPFSMGIKKLQFIHWREVGEVRGERERDPKQE